MLGEGTRRAYLKVREAVAPLVKDRTLDRDIRTLRRLLEDHALIESLARDLDLKFIVALGPIES